MRAPQVRFFCTICSDKLNILTIASDIRIIKRELQGFVDDPVVGAVHEAEVGAAVEHVEVDAGVVLEDVGQDSGKI